MNKKLLFGLIIVLSILNIGTITYLLCTNNRVHKHCLARIEGDSSTNHRYKFHHNRPPHFDSTLKGIIKTKRGNMVKIMKIRKAMFNEICEKEPNMIYLDSLLSRLKNIHSHTEDTLLTQMLAIKKVVSEKELKRILLFHKHPSHQNKTHNSRAKK